MHIRDMAGAIPFAHLLGLGAATGRRKACDDKDAPDAPAKTAPGAHLAGAPPEPEASAAAKDKDAPTDEEKSKSKDGDEDEDVEEGDKPKKKKAAADAARDADADDAAAQRGAAIFESPHAAGPGAALAAYLAFNTRLPAAQCAEILGLSAAAAQAPRGARASLDDRMSNLATDANPTPGAGAPPAPQGADAAAASILAAARRARGEQA